MLLTFIRHGEAGMGTDDTKRELTTKGIEDVKKTALFLKEYYQKFFKQNHIDKILVSPSIRTEKTADIIQDYIPINSRETCATLYFDEYNMIIELIKNVENYHNNLVIVGHNPTLPGAAAELSRPDSEKYEQLLTTGMLPGSAVVINFSDTDRLDMENGDMIEIFTP